MLHSVVRSSNRVVFAVALFCTLFFAKLWVVENYGSDVPNWDQWDAEGVNLLLPWSQGKLHVLDLFAPHNEHRVVLTKLVALGVVLVNGQWDARIQIFVNSALHSALAVALWFWVRPLLLQRWQRLLWALALVATFALPHAWQNTLGGFHSQQYFLLGLSFIGIDRCLRCRALTAGWWLGILCLILVLFSMASGPAAAGMVFVSLLVLEGAPWRAARRHAITLIACLIVMAAGIALHVEFTAHEPLRAHSFAEFGWTLWRSLQWPVTSFTPFGALTYLPWLILAVRVLWIQSRPEFDPRERVIVAIGGWVIVQFLAAAYARGAGGLWPASRYFDTNTAGLLVNLAAGMVLLNRSNLGHRARLGAVVAIGAWTLAIGHGLYGHARGLFTYDLIEVGKWYKRSTTHARLYLATQDASWLKEGEIPYPSVELFIERTAHPELRHLLPASVRAAMPLAEDRSTGFQSPGASPETPDLLLAPTWGSFDRIRGADGTGEWRSAVQPRPEFGYLVFETSGDLGRERTRLELWSADMTRRLGHVRPSKTVPNQWRAAYVAAPNEPFRVVARDEDPKGWLAFSAPIGMASGSYWCWRLASHAPLLTWISAGFLLITLPAVTRAGAADEGEKASLSTP
ncbi:MAG: hypothetical protein JNJ82_15015 [Opitutaceae bacterium]|nr:hypothetical protein [Opitutaceae bacterium]